VAAALEGVAARCFGAARALWPSTHTLSNRPRTYHTLTKIDPKLLHFGDKVGEGEFGNVFLATLLGTPVAVKVLKDNDAVTLGDFRTELNVLQKLHHPHCVQFFGAVTKSSPYMIVTEFMGAGTLADLFRSKNRLSLRRCVQLALECARGIAYLHNRQPQGIIHRDLKPACVFLEGGG
jgi:serine/threonine protein kinase